MEQEFKPSLEIEGIEDDQGFSAMLPKKKSFRITTEQNNYLDQYLRHNKHETEIYDKFVSHKKAQTEKELEHLKKEDRFKQRRIEPLLQIKRNAFQDIVPKFFLNKIQIQKELDVVSGKVNTETIEHGWDEIKSGQKSTLEGKDGTRQPPQQDNTSKNSKALGATPKAPPIIKNPFVSLFSGFTAQALKKVNYSGKGILELKDRSIKNSSTIVCAREGFTMVLTKYNFRGGPKELVLLGGIGSDIISSLDRYDLSISSLC